MSDPAIQKINGANGHANGSNGTNVSKGTGVAGQVIDLREQAPTRVRVARDDNPFLALSPPERVKLIIRVLCEIVAYGEIDDDVSASPGPDRPVVSG